MRSIEIAGRPVGPSFAPYIVAELSANHNGSLERSLSLVEAAASAGADAIKLQTLRPDTITVDSERDEFQITKGPRKGQSLYELYAKAETPWEWHKPLFEQAAAKGLAAFSAPFDLTAVDFLASHDVPAFKIASFEIVDIPLIKKAAAVGKPIIISTGMANLQEVHEAVGAAQAAGNDQIVLLYCVSGYPTPADELNLRNLTALREATDCLLGLSDHTLGTSAAVAAVSLGACLIEKHMTLKRSDGGLDASFSLEPEEMATLVRTTREAHDALGEVTSGLKPSEVYTSRLRRSLYVVADMAEGDAFSPANVRSIRPNNGLAPKFYEEILGRKATCRIKCNTPLDWSLIG